MSRHDVPLSGISCSKEHAVLHIVDFGDRKPTFPGACHIVDALLSWWTPDELRRVATDGERLEITFCTLGHKALRIQCKVIRRLRIRFVSTLFLGHHTYLCTWCISKWWTRNTHGFYQCHVVLEMITDAN